MTFLSVENILRFTAAFDYNGDDCLAFVGFRIDFGYDIYTRQIYSITDLLIQSALFSIGALIVGIFAQKLFYSKIISEIYQTSTMAKISKETKIK